MTSSVARLRCERGGWRCCGGRWPPPAGVPGARGGASAKPLRAQLADAGLRDLERQATYALERQTTRHKLQAWREHRLSSLEVGLEGAFRRIAFEVPVGYGLYPGRALLILLASISVFALVYLVPLSRR